MPSIVSLWVCEKPWVSQGWGIGGQQDQTVMLHYPDWCKSSRPRQELRKNQWNTSIKTIVAGAASCHLLATRLSLSVRTPARPLIWSRRGWITSHPEPCAETLRRARQVERRARGIGALVRVHGHTPSALRQSGWCTGPSWACWGGLRWRRGEEMGLWGMVRRNSAFFSLSLSVYVCMAVHSNRNTCVGVCWVNMFEYAYVCVCVCLIAGVCAFNRLSVSVCILLFPVYSGQWLPEADALFWLRYFGVGLYFSSMDTDCCWARHPNQVTAESVDVKWNFKIKTRKLHFLIDLDVLQ